MKSTLLKLIALATLLPSAGFAQNQALWIGDLSLTTQRGSNNGVYEQCNRNNMISTSDFEVTGGALSRSSVANLCFRVYAPGLSDAGGNPGELSIKVEYKDATNPDARATAYQARYVGQEGNNFVYALNLFDFFQFQGAGPNGNTADSVQFQLRGWNVARGGSSYGQTENFTMTFTGRP